MNRKTVIIIILAVLIIGGLVFFSINKKFTQVNDPKSVEYRRFNSLPDPKPKEIIFGSIKGFVPPVSDTEKSDTKEDSNNGQSGEPISTPSISDDGEPTSPIAPNESATTGETTNFPDIIRPTDETEKPNVEDEIKPTVDLGLGAYTKRVRMADKLTKEEQQKMDELSALFRNIAPYLANENNVVTEKAEIKVVKSEREYSDKLLGIMIEQLNSGRNAMGNAYNSIHLGRKAWDYINRLSTAYNTQSSKGDKFYITSDGKIVNLCKSPLKPTLLYPTTDPVDVLTCSSNLSTLGNMGDTAGIINSKLSTDFIELENILGIY